MSGTTVTTNWLDELVAWHKFRLIELQYPPEICRELSLARDRWVAQERARIAKKTKEA